MDMGGMVRSLAFVAVLMSVGCGRRGEQPAACVPGAVVTCPCAGAPVGSQTCQSNGTFGACACPVAAPTLPVDPDKPPPVTAPPEAPTPTPTQQTPVARTTAQQPRVQNAGPAPAATGVPDGATPMEQARACLRNNYRNMTVGNECVVSVLRNQASSESERGLLCVTYRTMGRTSDAVRCMRQYIQSYPDGPRATNFQQYVDINGP